MPATFQPTEEQLKLKETIAKGRTDWVLFINEVLGMELHQGQIAYIKEAQKAVENGDDPLVRRFLLSSANRWGKTGVIACIQIVYLYYKFGVKTATDEEWWDIEYRTANIAPYSALTEPVFKAIKAIMTSSYPIRDSQTGIMRTNKCKIEWFYIEDRTLNSPPYKQFFINNSYIEHLSLMGNKGDSLQGKPYGIITYDEAVRSNWLQIELDDAIIGRLLDWTAPLHLLSTPSQDSNSLLYFYKLYQEGLIGLNHSYTQTGSIYDNTFFTPAQIEEQVKLVGDNPLKDQILEGKFVFGGDKIFSLESIVEAQDPALNDGIRYQEGHKYVIGTDTAIGSDEMVHTVLDVTEKPFLLVRQMAVKGNSKSPQMHMNDYLDLVDSYSDENRSNIRLMLETWNGEAVRFYHDLPYGIQAITKCYGAWQPEKRTSENKNPTKPVQNSAKKADIIIALKKCLEAREIKIFEVDHNVTLDTATLSDQLSIYKEKDDKLPTDRVMSLALAVWLATEGSRFMSNSLDFIEW